MFIQRFILAAVAAFALYTGNALAVGTFIPASSRVDMVYDASRNIVYITEGGNVLRYHVPTASFLSPIVLGGDLAGIDLNDDHATLAVADKTSTATHQWVYLIRLSDLNVTKATVLKEFGENGTWSVAFMADWTVAVSGRYAGSGSVPLRRLNLNTMQWQKIGITFSDSVFNQNTMLAPSGNRQTLGFAEANSSAGPWGTYHINGTLVRRQGYTNGTSWFNYEMGTNSDGTQFAIPTYGGTMIYNSSYQKIATLGTYAGPQPIAAVYHPVEPLIYMPWTTTNEVKVFNATNLTQVDAFNFEDTFQNNGNWAYEKGRTKLSRDGSLLMVSVTGGVRIHQMYAPLMAGPVTGSVNAGSSVALGLKGSVGNGGWISYGIGVDQAKGTITANGTTVTYTPKPGATGTDTFKYWAIYGPASVEGTVTINILTPNAAPVARADSAQTVRNMAVTIPVLANDSDPDGDRLNITMSSSPKNGSVAIAGHQITFTPAKNFIGTTSFTYSVSDGKGASASAPVSVNVIKR